jgi:hypothetical protein
MANAIVGQNVRAVGLMKKEHHVIILSTGNKKVRLGWLLIRYRVKRC